MLIGKMNNPTISVIDEIALAAKQGFDYIDLTLEGPSADRKQLSCETVKRTLRRWNLGVIGHTAYYLPIDSCIDRLQTATIEELIDDLRFFADLGASKVTLHLGFSNPFKLFGIEKEQLLWGRALEVLLKEAERHDIRLILEHANGNQNTMILLEDLFAKFPPLGFHLDVGHANLLVERNTTPVLLSKFGDRLSHVHMSDNFGSGDLHLPLWCGNIDWGWVIKDLNKVKYDESITLEVFSRRQEYLLLSKEMLKELWFGIKP